jgi:hypothetical protein
VKDVASKASQPRNVVRTVPTNQASEHAGVSVPHWLYKSRSATPSKYPGLSRIWRRSVGLASDENYQLLGVRL